MTGSANASPGFSIDAETRRRQAIASDPERSVFVSANAGSGKTHVLTERVVRLLLSGVDPSKILCLTFTKAAAAEMSARVFARLGAWATMPGEALAEVLAKLEDGRRPDVRRLGEARQLFARALETPGGLKIQTIHAFCEAILHQFPLEADVPGHFAVMEEAEAARLLAETRKRLLTGSARLPQPEARRLADAFAEALQTGGEFGLDRLLADIAFKRDDLARHLEEAGGLGEAIGLLARALEVDDAETEEPILHSALDCPHLDPATCEILRIAALASKSSSDAKFAERLALLVDASAAPQERFAAYRAFGLDSKGEIRGSLRGLVTKAVAEFVPDFLERVQAAGGRAKAIEERLATLRLYRASRAALVVTDAFEREYAALKRRRGRLDFTDLIAHTADLLLRSEAASWVHYKLDKGIDHILIDEAQDTSPRQWQVMREPRRGILRRPRQPQSPAHPVCRRRREAVDLFLPGCLPAHVRRGAPPGRTTRRGSRHSLRSDPAQPLVPHRRDGAGRRRPGVFRSRQSKRPFGRRRGACPFGGPARRAGPRRGLAGLSGSCPGRARRLDEAPRRRAGEPRPPIASPAGSPTRSRPGSAIRSR
ncbi:UvrD-helicase domain-containing protein [Jiella pelagia]|uniref:UvrD-helicase domain-containing protein n=1 Tax=Jiella pelagia TaxID=2986949 RepID=UPI0038B24632